MAVCPNCRAQNPDGAPFCSACGARMGAGAPPTQRVRVVDAEGSAPPPPPPSPSSTPPFTPPPPTAAPGIYCRNCGRRLTGTPEYCMSCGARPMTGTSFCPACGGPTNAMAEICVRCGARLGRPGAPAGASTKSRTVLSLLAFFLGQFGIHRFYAGQVGTGVAMLLLTVIGWATVFFVVGFLLLGAVGIWNLVDFIMAVAGIFKDKDGNPISVW